MCGRGRGTAGASSSARRTCGGCRRSSLRVRASCRYALIASSTSRRAPPRCRTCAATASTWTASIGAAMRMPTKSGRACYAPRQRAKPPPPRRRRRMPPGRHRSHRRARMSRAMTTRSPSRPARRLRGARPSRSATVAARRSSRGTACRRRRRRCGTSYWRACTGSTPSSCRSRWWSAGRRPTSSCGCPSSRTPSIAPSSRSASAGETPAVTREEAGCQGAPRQGARARRARDARRGSGREGHTPGARIRPAARARAAASADPMPSPPSVRPDFRATERDGARRVVSTCP
mmetsp:Transcript_108008/g.300324  ORF Transcript_108008/g.300324 Transcript_108008/m.300324 type:complete len:290 (-) Transcript_108008:43-912(-)